MPHQVSWAQEKRIILVNLIGSLDLEAGFQASNETNDFINQGTAPVHLIVDMSELKSFPTNITKVNQMNQYLKNPARGWVVVIGGNTLSNFLVNVLSQVVKFPVTQRPALNDALDFLRKNDATLVETAPAVASTPAVTPAPVTTASAAAPVAASAVTPPTAPAVEKQS
jgi:hypothetical protein